MSSKTAVSEAVTKPLPSPLAGSGESVPCPKCQATNDVSELPARDYRCGECGFELAHLDMTMQGTVRGVIAWIRCSGAVVKERYKVTGLLGRGGFGVTYLVDDLLLEGKRRALKEIPEILFDEYEIRLLGRLSHPAIPDITDRFSDNGMNCLVLEFGGNRTLRSEQQRRGGRIPFFALLPWLRQLGEAIIYLHSQDPPIIHRDLKPDNILLDDHDRVMLIDFGIAKEAVADGTTRTLGRAASQGFSPPEQVLGTGTDERSDVYSLGAIVYNLLTGAMPAAAYDRVTGALLEPIRQFLPDIPPEIDAAVLKALELNINLRHRSIMEFLQCVDTAESANTSVATVMLDGASPVPGASANTGGTSASARLPSLRLPTGQAASASTLAAEVATGSRKGPWIAVGVAAILAVAAAGWWFFGAPGLNLAPGKIASEGADPQSEPVETALEGDDGETGSLGAGGAGEAAQEPLAAARVQDVIAEKAGGTPTADAEAAAAAGLVATAGAAKASGTMGDGGEEPDQAPSANDVAALAATAVPAGPMPSIFSDEQVPGSRQASRSSGSLMDLFDEHRAETAKAAVEVPSQQASTQAKPPPVTTATPKPEPKPRVVAKRPPPRRQSVAPSRSSSGGSSSSGSSSGWGFKYKGAQKQY